MRTLSWILLLGLWLIISAFVLSAGVAHVMAEEITLGIIIAVLATCAALSQPGRALSWSVVGAGLWTVIAVLFINYDTLHASKVNELIVGLAVVILALINAYRRLPTVLRS